MKHVTLVVASNGKNLTLAKQFEEKLTSLGAKVSLIDLVEAELPLYSNKMNGVKTGAEVIAPFLPALGADRFVFVAPEYNGALPPVFSNFIAWCSTSAKDWRVHFNGKKAAIATFSGGDGFQALMFLRLQLSYIGMTVIGRQINVSNQKNLDPNSLSDVCHQLLS